jgi:hypothetical protein
MIYKVIGFLILGFLAFCLYNIIFTDVDLNTAIPFIGLFASYGFVATFIAGIYLIVNKGESSTG